MSRIPQHIRINISENYPIDWLRNHMVAEWYAGSGGAVVTIYSDNRSVCITAEGYLRALLNGDLIAKSGDRLSDYFKNDNALEAAIDRGELELDNNPWFCVGDPNDSEIDSALIDGYYGENVYYTIPEVIAAAICFLETGVLEVNDGKCPVSVEDVVKYLWSLSRQSNPGRSSRLYRRRR